MDAVYMNGPPPDFRETLEDLTWRAHLLLAVCSNESVSMPWINYEAGGARARDVVVIPLCHSGMTPIMLAFGADDGASSA
jgi:hypothetical protein